MRSLTLIIPLLLLAAAPKTVTSIAGTGTAGAGENETNNPYGLTIGPDRLQQIRNERRPNSRYASPSQVTYEVRAAEAIFSRYDIPSINTTECYIEEIASRILDRTGIERRLRP